MNEYVNDLETAERAADRWIDTSSATVGSVCHKAGHDRFSVMTRGRNLYRMVRRRFGMKALRDHPVLPVLVGIGAGAILGYLMSYERNGR